MKEKGDNNTNKGHTTTHTNARAREKLGIPAAYGAPVMMPPTDRLTGALGLASQAVGIVSGGFNIASTIKNW